MKISIIATMAALVVATPVFAAGDAAKGEAEFKKCKACHMIVAADGTEIVKGGKTGPNQWNLIGSKVAAEEGFKYGDGLMQVAAANPDMVWTDELVVEYMTDPQKFIDAHGGTGGKSKMAFKLAKGQEDVAAYLRTVSPDAPPAQ